MFSRGFCDIFENIYFEEIVHTGDSESQMLFALLKHSQIVSGFSVFTSHRIDYRFNRAVYFVLIKRVASCPSKICWS